ncbi:uncharacterized protein BDW43DRAFT_258724 [Aspergillus alliaceus]|uniref:uncharacterized protein n=1 Tax=Petromyces alliaceus TaxID=209559 RepID=UPI0012A48C48|nr:uncharacterized protein BDW43DRAFT_258724 [Aspergillus alliaceus]KAB8239627.1 hypothetical protein BDW43DRAFT_258724 [Aspergillus alliaceus]
MISSSLASIYKRTLILCSGGWLNASARSAPVIYHIFAEPGSACPAIRQFRWCHFCLKSTEDILSVLPVLTRQP